jgi:hypothetical protein
MADLADPDESPTLFEHFFLWLNRHAPQYLDDLRRSFGADHEGGARILLPHTR